MVVRNAARTVAFTLDGLIHPTLNVVAEFREARRMDEEGLGLEPALNRRVDFGVTKWAEAAVAGVRLAVVVVVLQQIVDIPLLDRVRADGVCRVLHAGRPLAAERDVVGDDAIADVRGIDGDRLPGSLLRWP